MCGGNSIVHAARQGEVSPQGKSQTSQRRLRTQKHDSFAGLQTEKHLSSIGRAWHSFDQSPVQMYEYAKCTRISCSHIFCMKCLGPHHTGNVCTAKPLGSSPTSDEEYPARKASLRNRKHSLRRLDYD